MVRRRTLAATTSALFATTLIVTACSGDDAADDDDDDNNGGTSGSTGGKGGSSSGSGGTTAGTGTAGTTSGAAGTATAGMAGTGTGGSTAGTAGAAGASGSGGGTGGPFACKGVVAACNAISDFPAEGMCFGDAGEFRGGVGQPYDDGTGALTLDQSGGALHVSGMVNGYYGFNLWFSYCSDLSAYTGVSFMASGTIAAAGTKMGTIDFQLQTNSDFPWQTPDNMRDMKGSCTAMDATMPWADCNAPSLGVPVAATPTLVEVTWDKMMGGKPAHGNCH